MSNKKSFWISDGKSMNPLIEEGDILILEKTKNIKLFGIYVFYNKKTKKLIGHRVVRINKNKLVFHGDTAASFFKCNAGFELGAKKEVKGKITGIIRKSKKMGRLKFMVLSFLSLVYASIRVLPFLIKKYITKR